MGNAIFKKKHTVDERYTRPQREPTGVDYKRLRKLILTAKLAPCFPGAEDSSPDLEECPICFYFYPSLNRSRCCMKGICTECFLLMKPSVAYRLAQCPFCKTSSYAVEYRGPRTQEEKGLEQAEEQKVIEAKIRMQCQEEQSIRPPPCNGELSGDARDIQGCETSLGESTEVVGSPSPNAYNNRNGGFDLDLEEIMMMEAIWLSIQDPSSHRSVMLPSMGPSSTIGLEPVTHGSVQTASVTGGLALAIAKLAEQNVIPSESLHLVGNRDQSDQTQDENGIEESPSNILQTASLDASSPEVGHEREASRQDFDVRSENECVPSWSSMSEHDVSEALSASPLESNWGSESGLPGVIDVESYCSSSIHSISNTSFGSSDCSEDSTSPLCSQLSGPITVERQFMAMALPLAGSRT